MKQYEIVVKRSYVVFVYADNEEAAIMEAEETCVERCHGIADDMESIVLSVTGA